jgi:DNA-binding MarR family transcriptional regulator
MRLPLPQRAVSIGLAWSPATAKNTKNTPTKFEIHNFIPYQLVVLANYVGIQLLRAYNRYGLSVPEWRVIVSIARGPIIANEIVMRVQLDEVTVHRAVVSLIKRGLIRRTIDIADRRRRRLHLTPSGKATYRGIVPLAREFEDWTLAKLSQNERKNFVLTLRKLCRNLHLITQCPSTKASAKGNNLNKYRGG